MIPNPFVGLWESPVVTLTAIAYVLLLLSVSIALAGVVWNNAVRVKLSYKYRHTEQKFGPQWSLVPPLSLVARLAGMVFLGSVEFALFAGIAAVVT